mmetsp:Transcript_139730/g.267864  ORF Transcript_139730/g.267864 Transcript_139730/m.267864 type:complete len:212 (-) Transcript_139730:2-637(-)
MLLLLLPVQVLSKSWRGHVCAHLPERGRCFGSRLPERGRHNIVCPRLPKRNGRRVHGDVRDLTWPWHLMRGTSASGNGPRTALTSRRDGRLLQACMPWTLQRRRQADLNRRAWQPNAGCQTHPCLSRRVENRYLWHLHVEIKATVVSLAVRISRQVHRHAWFRNSTPRRHKIPARMIPCTTCGGAAIALIICVSPVVVKRRRAGGRTCLLL